MKDQQQLSEEEIEDLRHEMQEDLEKIQFELKRKSRDLGHTGPKPSEHSLEVDVHSWPFDKNE